MTKADAGRALEAAIEGIVEGLKKEKKVSLVGFGSFSAKDREEREGRNPQTGAVVNIAARNAVTFKAGAALKESVN